MNEAGNRNKLKNSDLPEVLFLTKQNCMLCDEALYILENVRKDNPFNLLETDITGDKELYDKYITELPVVFLNGEKIFIHFVDEYELREKLLKCM